MNLMAENKENTHYVLSDYEEAYTDGYHDALVDLLDRLGIEHSECLCYKDKSDDNDSIYTEDESAAITEIIIQTIRKI